MPQQESIDQPVVNRDGIYVWFMVISVVATIVAISLTYYELTEFYLN